MNRYIKEVQAYPISDALIKEYLPDTDIIMYNQLKNYDNIEQLLPHDKSSFVLMYLDSPNSGHWTCCLRQKNTIEYFDSYGSYPDDDLKWVSADRRHELGVNDKYLSRLLDKTKLNVIYNTEDYQSKGRQFATCGRHVIYRLKNIDKSLKNYHKFISNEMKKSGCGYDCVVSKAIPEMG
jgi:hypothetical protein